MATLPLEGVRILAQAIVWSAPYATMILADMGAEILEIEHIHKIPWTRSMGLGRAVPMALPLTAFRAHFPEEMAGEHWWDRNATFNYSKRNCRSFTINWEKPKGMELFLRLVKISDIVLENNAADVWAKLGITYDRLKEVNPQIIFLSMPGFGNTGPYRHFKGFGANMEAVSGHTWLRSYRDLDLTKLQGIYQGDPAAGAHAAFAVMAALHYRKRTGKGQFIDLSQMESVAQHLAHGFMDYSLNRRDQEPWANLDPSMAPHNVYPCAGEDYWVAIAVEDDEQFAALCRVMGRAELAQDERYADAVSRYRNQGELDKIIAQWTKDKGHYEVMHLLQGEGVPAVAVLKQTEMVTRDKVGDPHLRERGYFEWVTHPHTGPTIDGKDTPGTHLYPGPLAKLSKTPLSIRTPAPPLGQDNDYVYKQLLGLSDAEYEALLVEDITGDAFLDTAT